eukprot:TRINITY_DN2018_c0_g1_i1.p1 TRINITY_DN2018_c0_g1~~TRINITY_DN2018_c0_g1_i1.p1  ORF type:complete len:409 (-),score=122.28 TRINITY_DN2018_c0_g1_i1:47-1225(-)
MSFSLTFFFEEDVALLPNLDQLPRFENLNVLTSSFFPKLGFSVDIKYSYFDEEGDLIYIESDADFEEALRIHQDASSAQFGIPLFVTADVLADETENVFERSELNWGKVLENINELSNKAVDFSKHVKASAEAFIGVNAQPIVEYSKDARIKTENFINTNAQPLVDMWNGPVSKQINDKIVTPCTPYVDAAGPMIENATQPIVNILQTPVKENLDYLVDHIPLDSFDAAAMSVTDHLKHLKNILSSPTNLEHAAERAQDHLTALKEKLNPEEHYNELKQIIEAQDFIGIVKDFSSIPGAYFSYIQNKIVNITVSLQGNNQLEDSKIEPEVVELIPEVVEQILQEETTEKIPVELASYIQALNDMGFTDQDLNIQLLYTYDLDLTSVVAELLG